LAPGDYTVTVNTGTIPAAYSTTPTNGLNSRPFTLSADDVILHADFGYPPAGTSGSIGDTVYLDLDGNGSQSAGEPGLAGVTLNLRTGSGVIASMVTDANGNYDFLGLAPDSYTVEVTDLNGILVDLNPTQTAPDPIVITGVGEDVDTADFGYTASSGGYTVGGTVWHDQNQVSAVGVLDPGEFGIEGVSVQLWADLNGDGVVTPGVDNLLRTSFTDVNGEYEFAGLTPGDYLVRVTDALGVLSGMNLVAGPGPGQDGNSQVNPYAVTLTSGSPTNFTADFGYEASGPNALEGTTFFDVAADQDIDDPPDVGIGGVEALLYRDLDGDGVLGPGDTLFSRTSTDANGEYLFADLPDGDWIIAADTTGTFLEGTTQTTQTATAGVEPVSASGGTTVTDLDFGFHIGGITLALISSFDASLDSGQVVVEWETSSEVGTLGFYVFRWGGGRTGWVQIHDTMLPGLINSPLGGQYSVIDETAPSGRALMYQLVEIEAGGVERHYGPYRVHPDSASKNRSPMTRALQGAQTSHPTTNPRKTR
jgi:hypothetical protein